MAIAELRKDHGADALGLRAEDLAPRASNGAGSETRRQLREQRPGILERSVRERCFEQFCVPPAHRVLRSR